MEQLVDKSEIYSGLVDIEVMDEDIISCKRVSKGKQVEPSGHSCLQVDEFSFKVGKGSGQECGQNGPLALIFEIFGPETLFGKYIGKYHFLWYSSLVSSSTPF